MKDYDLDNSNMCGGSGALMFWDKQQGCTTLQCACLDIFQQCDTNAGICHGDDCNGVCVLSGIYTERSFYE